MTFAGHPRSRRDLQWSDITPVGCPVVPEVNPTVHHRIEGIESLVSDPHGVRDTDQVPVVSNPQLIGDVRPLIAVFDPIDRHSPSMSPAR
jgi:hypothetical protein